MVEHYIVGYPFRPDGTGQGSHTISIYAVERHVHGNGISIHVWGSVVMAAKEVLWAQDLKLNTIEWMNLTVETGVHSLFHAQKWIYSKGAYGNYASVDIFAADYAYEMPPGTRGGQAQAPAYLPVNGSITIEFEVKGE